MQDVQLTPEMKPEHIDTIKYRFIAEKNLKTWYEEATEEEKLITIVKLLLELKNV